MSSVYTVPVSVFSNLQNLIHLLTPGENDRSSKSAKNYLYIDSRNSEITVDQYFSILNFFASQLQCQDFGLRLASMQSVSIIGNAWLIHKNAFNLHQAIERLSFFFDYYCNTCYVVTEKKEDFLKLSYGILSPSRTGDMHAIDQGLALICNEIKNFLGDAAWFPLKVCLRRDRPKDIEMYKSIFGRNVTFNQKCNAIYIDNSTLHRDLRFSLDHEQISLQNSVEHSLVFRSKLYGLKVKQYLYEMLGERKCDLISLANHFEMSSRSLQRLLNAEGHCYHELIDQIRTDLFLTYMHQSNLSLAKISEYLGFVNFSSFSRFVKRSMGQTPGQIRETHFGRSLEVDLQKAKVIQSTHALPVFATQPCITF